MHWAAYKGHSDIVSLYATGQVSGALFSTGVARIPSRIHSNLAC